MISSSVSFAVEAPPVRTSLGGTVLCTLIFAVAASRGIALSADGWAGMNGGTTGGTGGVEVTVDTAAAFLMHTRSPDPCTIQVSGTINLGNNEHKVGSNKTIVGRGTTGRLIGTLIFDARTRNVIVKNLTMTTFDRTSDRDAISIRGGKNIWVNHCTFFDCADGSVDQGVGADFITISWCKYYYTMDFGHNLVNLIGSNNEHGATDAGRLRVTLHHNWYGNGCTARMPFVRYGKVHVYNTFYNSPGNNIYINVAIASQILVENCYFEGGNQKTPKIWYYYDHLPRGRLRQTGNVFVNVPVPDTGGSDTVFTPPYPFTLDPAGEVKAIVTAGAGVNGDSGGATDRANAMDSRHDDTATDGPAKVNDAIRRNSGHSQRMKVRGSGDKPLMGAAGKNHRWLEFCGQIIEDRVRVLMDPRGNAVDGVRSRIEPVQTKGATLISVEPAPCGNIGRRPLPFSCLISTISSIF